MKNKRVAVYCRVSTLQEMQDTSFEIQRDAYIQMIASRDGLVLVDVYGDLGKSGTSIKRRPEFQRMIHDCEGGKIDIVMTKSISRFARNLRDCLTTIDHLKQLGIPIFFEKEGINTMDNKSELLLNIAYLLIDYLIAIAYEDISEIRREIDDVAVGNRQIWALLRKLNQPFDAQEWEKITKDTTFFKLSYKDEFNGGQLLRKTEDGSITYWGHLLETR